MSQTELNINIKDFYIVTKKNFQISYFTIILFIEINAALLSIKDFFQKHLTIYWAQTFELYVLSTTIKFVLE